MSHDPSQTHTVYLSDFDEDDLVKRLQSRGYSVVKTGPELRESDDEYLPTPSWIEDEADALYRTCPDLPKPAQRFLARIIGSVKP